jgi:hypothetical protein
MHASHTNADEFAGANVTFTVSETALAQHNATADSVGLYRSSDGSWTAAQTEYLGQTEAGYRYEGYVPDFSTLTVAAEAASIRPAGSFGQVNASVDDTVARNVTLVNRGQRTGSYSLAITAGNETVRTVEGSLAPGEQRNVSLNHSFARTGTYAVAVGGDSVGAVRVVESSGGFPWLPDGVPWLFVAAPLVGLLAITGVGYAVVKSDLLEDDTDGAGPAKQRADTPTEEDDAAVSPAPEPDDDSGATSGTDSGATPGTDSGATSGTDSAPPRPTEIDPHDESGEINAGTGAETSVGDASTATEHDSSGGHESDPASQPEPDPDAHDGDQSRSVPWEDDSRDGTETNDDGE